MTTPTNMPPLPEPCGLRNEYCDQFTWEQMHAYAQAHAAQQCAALKAKLAAAVAQIQMHDIAMKSIEKQACLLLEAITPKEQP